METFAILFIFIVCPLALLAFIIAASIHRAKQKRTIAKAAEKYLHS
jgi:hypothetical protein